MRKPLEGIRIVDFTWVVAGPFGTRTLRDMGAEVIKIEPPYGDEIRFAGPFPNGESNPEKSGLFLSLCLECPVYEQGIV
mgnify:CR=1 FL=1